MGRLCLYSVTVVYDNLPPFSCTVYAYSEENAKRIGADEAMLKGWPKTFLSVTVTKAEL